MPTDELGLTDDERRFIKKARNKTLLWTAIVMVVVLVLGVAGFAWNQAFRRTTAPIEGETQAIEQTQGSGDYRIQSYNWYFQQCGSIQAAEDRIENQMMELDTVEVGSDRYNQIQSNLVAQRNVRDELIRDYNATAAQEETTGQFRDDGLPVEIDPNNETTTCS